MKQELEKYEKMIKEKKEELIEVNDNLTKNTN
jgi:hypothetical protein